MQTTENRPFDFAFNGTMSQAQMDQLLTLDFIRQGKNLAAIGHIGTGKTETINQVRCAARAIGLTEHYIWDRPMSIYGTESAVPEVLSADILVVDEFNYWLVHETQFALDVLTMRGMLGKSTLVTILDSAVHHVGSKKLWDCPRGYDTGLRRSALSERLRYMARVEGILPVDQVRCIEELDGNLTVLEVLKALGIDLAPPAEATLDQVHTTDKWLHIYTGTKSYRDVLLGRVAA